MNAKKGKKSLGSIMICMACTLFCLVLISTSMMSGLYARYTARGEGNDSARVAKFVVGGALSPENVLVDIGKGQTDGVFSLTTQNASEVSVKYDVIIETVTALPEGVAVKLDDEQGILSDGKYTFTDVDSLSPNLDSGSHEIKFTVSDIDKFTAPAIQESYSKEISFTVTVKFVQID